MKDCAEALAVRGSFRSSSCQTTSPRPGSRPSLSTRSRASFVRSWFGEAMYTFRYIKTRQRWLYSNGTNLRPQSQQVLQTCKADATATQSVSLCLRFQNRFADLDPVTIATFPFRLGRSSSGLKDFEGAAPIFSGGWKDGGNHCNNSLTVQAQNNPKLDTSWKQPARRQEIIALSVLDMLDMSDLQPRQPHFFSYIVAFLARDSCKLRRPSLSLWRLA